MTHTIKLKDGSVEPAALAEGELALDEPGQGLFVQTLGGVKTLPLDRVALEPADPQASSQAYLYHADGIARRGELDPGAGGAPLDSRAWCVPGLTPVAVTSRTVQQHQAVFEVLEPLVIRRLRMRRLGAGATPVEVVIRDRLNAPRASVTLTGDAVLTATLAAQLDPGAYTVALTAAQPQTFETVVGRLPWRANAIEHLVMMGVD